MSAYDPWEVVRQFDGMRGSLGSGLTALQSYAKPQVQQTTAPRTNNFAVASAALAAAPRPQPQPVLTPYGTPATSPSGTKRKVTTNASGQLVPYAGYQFDGAIVPKVQQLRAAFPGLRVTSGHRDAARNAAVGGVKNSWHLQGRAVDLVGSAGDMARGAAWSRHNGAREVLVHRVKGGQHLHAAW